MKTRLKSTPQRDSFRLDVIDNGKLTEYHFKEFKKKIEFQNKKLKHK